MIVFGFAVVMVFLVLAAQYESWSLPLAVILVVPMCLLFAVLGVWCARQDANIFTQIGFVVLVGLASKNAILIVEFAKQRREAGAEPRRAALDACTLRLRPIIMTSLAFIMGVVPLLTSRGAGAEMRHTLGTTVFSGMLGVTVFGIFLTPVFFFVVNRLADARVFTTAPVRFASGLALDLLSLGYLKRLARRVSRATAAAPSEAVSSRRASANGHAHGNGNGNGHGNGQVLVPTDTNGGGDADAIGAERQM
jgi:multidrug efflux pump